MIVLCAAIEIAVAAGAIAALKSKKPFLSTKPPHAGLGAVAGIFLAFLLAHTVHVYLWAIAFWGLGALPGYEAPIYFALVSYSTLGYGDVTLASDFRIFGAMASICGVLMFGLTTAFMVSVFTRFLVD